MLGSLTLSFLLLAPLTYAEPHLAITYSETKNSTAGKFSQEAIKKLVACYNENLTSTSFTKVVNCANSLFAESASNRERKRALQFLARVSYIYSPRKCSVQEKNFSALGRSHKPTSCFEVKSLEGDQHVGLIYSDDKNKIFDIQLF